MIIILSAPILSCYSHHAFEAYPNIGNIVNFMILHEYLKFLFNKIELLLLQKRLCTSDNNCAFKIALFNSSY